jgi:DNA-directed RNA polymerase specialized sigma24 family protein
MRTRCAAVAEETPELKRLRLRCWHVALELFDDDAAAEEAIDEIFRDTLLLRREAGNPAAVETLLLGEVVRRARQHARDTSDRRSRHARTKTSVELPLPLWRALHERGDLVPLLAQLPTTHAEAFALRYIEKATLRDMMRRTGASAGVVTHRVTQACERLLALTASADGAAR